MFKKIVVGTDGSDTASAAVAHASAFAKAQGAELIVVHAYPPPRADAGPPFGAQPVPVIDIGRGILRDVEKKYPGVRTVMLEGDAADVICDVAESEGADLVIVGNKGMTGAKRFLLGSVPNRVSHHAPTSVLIVHTT